MADGLLTSLCSICHVGKLQYRCPRCGVRTCSLPCVTKHKAWSQCSGERDPTAYVPRSKLRTAAGVDHDYNFLHGIELAAERAERVLVGDKGIIQAEELRPLTTQEVRWRTGRDGRRKKVLVTRVLREPKERAVERHLMSRLAKLNIEMLCAPTGMSRQRENHTTLNRRTGRINWQVEWFSWDDQQQQQQQQQQQLDACRRPARVLSKVMDDVPLYRAYHGMLEDQDRAQGKVVKKAVRLVSQSFSASTWLPTYATMQDPASARWVVVPGSAAVDVWPEERDCAQRQAFDFYLSGRRAGADQVAATVVARLDPGGSLREVLADTRVLEFPSVYVLRRGEGLPAGFVLGPKDSIPAKARTANEGPKREAEGPLKSGGRPAKRRRGDGQDEGKEDGELDDEHKGSVVEGDVIAEQELMEEGEAEEEEEEDEDDMTSSSGSDSEA